MVLVETISLRAPATCASRYTGQEVHMPKHETTGAASLMLIALYSVLSAISSALKAPTNH